MNTLDDVYDCVFRSKQTARGHRAMKNRSSKMKSVGVILLVTFIFVLVAGCSSQNAIVTPTAQTVYVTLPAQTVYVTQPAQTMYLTPAALNEEFRLLIGETAAITGEGLLIKFEAVTADSRCPQGVTCIWAGEAKCQTIVTLNKTTTPLILTVSGSSISQTVFEGYTLNFNLEPYPQAQQTIAKNSYVLVMKITQ
jgi:hypothetical protein